MDRFFKYLEDTGRCRALVDTFGGILFKRYFLFGVEPDEQDVESGKAKARWFPNVWLHRINESENGADASTYHRHPWKTMSYIVSGGYKEHFEGQKGIWRNKGDIVFRDDKIRHYIGKTKDNTTTLFFHWFRSSPSWNFKPSHCETVCEHCIETNDGVCKKGELEFTFKDYLEKLSKQEIPKWVLYNDKGKKKIALRQRAAKKLGVQSLTLAKLEKLLQSKFQKAPEIINKKLKVDNGLDVSKLSDSQ